MFVKNFKLCQEFISDRAKEVLLLCYFCCLLLMYVLVLPSTCQRAGN